ncbi:hypothetical protein [Dyadobacter fermentans]|uniref:Uncharacterized protein n=1 Tax=Dyadobacter fermentans (strain ATCC 700827 / DSM 18053 / CIP 107007 / KCTC 52180 / NS114) TaxID=471854 RepID=C6W6B1_DYAFD|nr:hypothetical protein [Dyadobacter fermentans]ACT94251.1 hypothetical protein Dfer_3036 [Dyadobacter fermentans DSM 18053]
MKRKDKHIGKFLRDPLPDPEIPADDAWADMQRMLDTAGIPEANEPDKLSPLWPSPWTLKGLLIGLSAVTVTLGLIAWVTIQNAETPLAEHPGKTLFDNAGTPLSENAEAPLADYADTPLSNDTDTPPPTTKMLPKSISGPDSMTTLKRPSSRNSRVQHSKMPDKNMKRGTTEAEGDLGNTKKSQNLSIDLPNPDKTEQASDDLSAPNNAGRRIANASDMDLKNVSASRANTTSSRTARNANERANDGYTDVANSNTGNAAATPMSVTAAGDVPASKSLPTSIAPLPGHFESHMRDLSARIVKPDLLPAAEQSPEARKQVISRWHVGPEWSLFEPFYETEYLLTGADSIKRPARLAIPGIFVSKNWNRHAATFVFTPSHSYFGNFDRVAQKTDTIPSQDSTLTNFQANTNFIKATGLNFTLHYQYGVTRWLSLSAGASYARFFRALFRKETVTGSNPPVPGSHVQARGREAMNGFIDPQQWTIRAGLIVHPHFILDGRLQTGLNVIVPVSNMSQYGPTRIRSANAQIFIRLLVR